MIQLSYKQQIAFNSLSIIAGNALYALTVVLFLVPSGLITGGATGIALGANRVLGLPVSGVLFVINISMLVLGWMVLGSRFALTTIASTILSPLQQCLYGIVMVIVYTAVLDKVLIFGSTRTEVKIISQHADEIREAIFSQLDRGVTILHGEGGYSRNSEQVLLSVVSNRQLPKLEKIAHLIDPTCFMIVSHVTEVSGRGFSLEKDYKEED